MIPTSIVDQVRLASQVQNRRATIAGFILGGFIPGAVFSIVHFEVSQYPILWLIVAGGLGFSALTVYQWSNKAFNSAFKAAGFVLLVEGVMTFSSLFWLSCLALGLLTVINGIATGCNLALDRKETSALVRAAAKPAPAPKPAKAPPVVKARRPIKRKSIRVNFKKGKKKKAA